MTDASPLPPNLRRRQRYQLRRRRYGALTPEGDLGAGAQIIEVESQTTAEELEKLRERLLRVQADHENHRKRMLRERDEQARFALEGIMHGLILSMDNFERALEHRTHTPEVEAFAKGLELTHRQLWETLAKSGLERIEALGKPFDPHVHEAMATVEAEEVEDGTVLDVIQVGYSLSGRVLRPALVRVAKSKLESDPASD